MGKVIQVTPIHGRIVQTSDGEMVSVISDEEYDFSAPGPWSYIDVDTDADNGDRVRASIPDKKFTSAKHTARRISAPTPTAPSKRAITEYRQIEIGRQMARVGGDWKKVAEWIEKQQPKWKRSRATIYRAYTFFCEYQNQLRKKDSASNKNDTQ